jgi:hypothetical protein
MRYAKKIGLYCLALLPLYSLAMASISVFLFSAAGIIFYFENKTNSIPKREKWIGLFWLSLPFTLNLLSFLGTDYSISGLSFVNRNLSFLIIPFVFFWTKPFKSELEINRFVKIYIYSSFFLAVIVLSYLTFQVFNGGITFDISSYSSMLEMRSKIDEIPIVHEHPIYLVLILGAALIFLFYNRLGNYWLNIMVAGTMILLIFIASSRGPLLALVLVYCGIIWLNFRSKKKAAAVLFLFLTAIGITAYYSPLKSRVLEVYDAKSYYPEGTQYNSFNLRMGIYKCSFEIARATPLLGFGSGNVQTLLDQCYADNFNTEAYRQIKYNTHNQFFFNWISFGPLGFSLILISYFIFLKRALRNKDMMYFFFLVFFIISFLTENILSRNTGIMIFVIFNSLFYYKTFLLRDSN